MSEQLPLFEPEPPWRCPLYGCRQECNCSPETIAETKRRTAALEARDARSQERRREASLASSVRGPTDEIPF